MHPEPERGNRKARFYGWWYLCIGLGFAVLGVRSYLFGGRLWLTLLRCIIAAGFLALGWLTLRALRRR